MEDKSFHEIKRRAFQIRVREVKIFTLDHTNYQNYFHSDHSYEI